MRAAKRNACSNYLIGIGLFLDNHQTDNVKMELYRYIIRNHCWLAISSNLYVRAEITSTTIEPLLLHQKPLGLVNANAQTLRMRGSLSQLIIQFFLFVSFRNYSIIVLSALFIIIFPLLLPPLAVTLFGFEFLFPQLVHGFLV